MLWPCLFPLFFGVADAAPPAVRALQGQISRVAREATPAVVRLQVRSDQRIHPALQELLAAHGLARPQWRQRTRESSGSGVFIDPAGLILTNHHVVDGAEWVQVVLADQRTYQGRVLVSDPLTDLAVVEVEAEGPWPYLPLGGPRALEVGDLVVAIGSPFDFQSTVTFGIVSAMGRRALSGREIQDYIQTDAVVNPGNSGGPLLDLDGNIVGLNAAIYAPASEQNAGISFAIPADMLQRITEDMLTLGRVRRTAIGILARTVDEVEGAPERPGARVDRVLAGGPAATAGLRRGDVIIAVDGESTPTANSLDALLRSRAVDQRIVLQVMRNDEELSVAVVTADQERLRSQAPADVGQVWRGLRLAEPTEALSRELGVATDVGLVITAVLEDGPSAGLGLAPGDVVLGVGAIPLMTLGDLAELDSGALTVLYDRAGYRGWAVVPGDL